MIRVSHRSALLASRNAASAERHGKVSVIKKIRRCILEREYYLSSHAEEEMLDDGFERADVEHAILQGVLEKRMTHDTRGTRYRIQGPARSGALMHVICRFREEANLIIITVYAL